MKSLTDFISEDAGQSPIRPSAISDWRNTYKGGMYWSKYLKDHPKAITSICAALVDKSVDNWNGRKGVISDFISMFFCRYIGRNQEPLASVKSYAFDREEGKRMCNVVLVDKWNRGELASFHFVLDMGDEKSVRAYRNDKVRDLTKRRLIITANVAKYRGNNAFSWVKLKCPILKIDIPPINDSNRGSFHEECIKQMLDAAHYVNWGALDPDQGTDD